MRTTQLTFVVQNTGNVSVNPVDCLVRGIVDASGASTERISEHPITCLPAGGSQTVSVAIPANPYHAYQVRIVSSGLSEIVAERVYPRQ
ncbi:MAG: hypothetical protein FP816_18170 [Desulfobacteraceae bacterium]|nr:hypothetical protein [Desulfobacteraceae bacterium]